MSDKKPTPSHALMLRVRQAFAEHGYQNLTMAALAAACGFTRRALYHYFSGKEEAYRAAIAHTNETAIQAGLEAGEAVRGAGGDARDILSEILDVRYGTTRRHLNESPHRVELNGEAFLRCHDLMVSSAIEFHGRLEALIVDFTDQGLLDLLPDTSPAELACLLADGARGVNQSLPPVASEDLAGRYRQMTSAILFGATRQPDVGQASRPRRVAGAGR